VRIINPALTSSTSAIATCTTTSALRTRWRSRVELAVRPMLPSPADTAAPCTSARGFKPNNMLDNIEEPP
jgi:hypothetical protein